CALLVVCSIFRICFSFFFQAEDGIRDFHVTGVQTCALPICFVPLCDLYAPNRHTATSVPRQRAIALMPWYTTMAAMDPSAMPVRSEERRVGKECRYRGSPHHEKDDNRCADPALPHARTCMAE